MSDVFIGRQPIYNAKLDIVAYELLLRSGGAEQADVVDGDVATGEVLVTSLIEIGLDQLVGDRVAFVNFTRRFLLEPDSLPFDKNRVAVEILETIEPDEEVVAAVRRLAQAGYRIVLDDFVYAEKYQALVALADTVKIDFRAMNRQQLTEQVRALRARGVRQLLAEKIETTEEFELCQQLGFDLFQGYFLSRPKIISGKAIPANRLAALQLVAKLQQPHVEIEELSTMIAGDVALSYKLLQYINSSAVGLKQKVESIRQAVVLLGLRNLRMMATLISLAGINPKPPAVMDIAVTRAKMCELLARAIRRDDSDMFALVGLFSTLDVLLDRSLADVLAPLPLADNVKQALLSFHGPMGEAHRCALAAERSEWAGIQYPGLSRPQIYDTYWRAVDASQKMLEHVA